MSTRISRLFGRVGGLASCAALSAALGATPAAGQVFLPSELSQPAEHDLSMALSCSTLNFEPQRREAAFERYAAYQTRIRQAPRGAESLHMAFLLKPPFACTPRVDALYSQKLDDLAALTDAEFAALGIRFAPSRAERVGTYEQRREFDRRANRVKEQFASFRTLLRERRFEDAHDLLDALNPGASEANLLGLSQVLLNSTDAEAQQYGRRCLHRIEGVDPVVAFDTHLLAGAMALKERHWTDAMNHYERLAETLPQAEKLLVPEELNRRLRETYLSRTYASERRGNHSRALNDIDLVIALDPTDRVALWHKAALMLMRLGSYRSGEHDRIEEQRKLFLEWFPPSTAADAASTSALVNLPELMFVELQLHVFGHSPELIERWEKAVDEQVAKGLAPEVQALARLKSAELYAARLDYSKAAEKLAEAERLDHAQVAAAPQWPELLFTLSDARTVKVLGDRFFVDPTDHASGRMLVLALLDSTDSQQRSRGAAIAELLHGGNPGSAPLTVAAANAHFMHGRNEEALKLVEPLVGFHSSSLWERMGGHAPSEARWYDIDARAFSPFSLEGQTQAWFIVNDGLQRERDELKESPLALEASDAAPPPPAALSADDAYLVARILFRMADAKSPERITRARALLEEIARVNEPMRYRLAAERLRADASQPLSSILPHRLGSPPSLLRPKAAPVDGLNLPGITR